MSKSTIRRLAVQIGDTELLNWLEKQEGGALISDDMGHWAFCSDGFQNLPCPNDKYFDLESTFLVEKHAFQDSVREAIVYAMELELKRED